MRKSHKRGKKNGRKTASKFVWDDPAIVGITSIDRDMTEADAEIIVEELTMFAKDITRAVVWSTSEGLAIVMQPNYQGLSDHERPALQARIENSIKDAVHHKARVHLR